jgi:hypothetical protein
MLKKFIKSCWLLLILVVAGLSDSVHAADLEDFSWEASSNLPGAENVTYTFNYKTVTELKSSDRVFYGKISFAPAWNPTGASVSVTVDGASKVITSSYLTVGSASISIGAVPANSVVKVILSNVKNGPHADTNYWSSMGTTTSSLWKIDSANNPAELVLEFPKHIVNAIAGDNGSISPLSKEVSQGSTTNFTITPNTGYVIDTVTGCEGTLTGINTYTTGAISYACTVEATFKINSYTLTFDLAGGSGVEKITANYGSAIIAPDNPTRVGYSFTGWSSVVPATMPAENTTLIAQWTANNYLIVFNSNGGSVVTDMVVGFGNAVTSPSNPIRAGYSFTGWNPTLPHTMPANNLSVSAQWTANSYTLSFDSAEGSAVAAITADFASTITPPANPTRAGYTFAGWSPAVPATMPAANTTVIAQWTINQYTLSFDSSGGSAVAAITADFASTITPPVKPTRAGYAFAGWEPELPATMLATDLTLTALWQENSFAVTATLIGKGAISPASQQVEHGKTAVFALTVLELDTIVNIDGSCGAARSGDNIITAAITGDCDVQVSTYSASVVNGDLSTPASSGSLVEFSINGGAGDKELVNASITRANIETELELDSALALLDKMDNGKYQFTAKRTGHYILMFRDVVSGETIPVEITILPYLAFASSVQPVNADSTANIKLWLSDEPAYYPVTAMLSTVGAEDKTISLLATDNRQYTYSIAVTADTELVLDDVKQALNGTPKRHQLQLQVAPIALGVQAIATQQGQETVVINQEGGEVTLSAMVLNADNINYSWSSESLGISADSYQFAFNPVSVSTGVHKITVNVSNAAGQQGQYLLSLQLLSHCVEDNCYSKNGLPASVLASEQPQRLPVCPAGDNQRVEQCQLSEQGGYIATSELYQLTLGEWSMAESWDNMQFGAALGKALAEDAGYTHQGVVVNFDITELSVPGESVPVVISLPVGQQIMADAVWRKYVNGRWQDFVLNGSNIIESAATDANKQCPAVSSDVWQSGLTAGHGCIRLTIQDGGPNDNDAKANGVIQDPGVLAVVNATKPLPPETPNEVKPRSSGSLGTLFIVFMSLVLVWRCRVLVGGRM